MTDEWLPRHTSPSDVSLSGKLTPDAGPMLGCVPLLHEHDTCPALEYPCDGNPATWHLTMYGLGPSVSSAVMDWHVGCQYVSDVNVWCITEDHHPA